MTPHRGFTLVELVVVLIVIGVLAAVALPRFIDLGQDARRASLAALAGTLRSTSENVRVVCQTNPACDYGNADLSITLSGRPARLNYGWLDAGDSIGGNEIDTWVTYTGFTASLPDPSRTLFTLDGAPDPANCSVSYYDAYYRGPAAGATVTTTTTGC